MYYDEVQLTTRTAPEVLFLAQKYLIPSLAETCTEFVAKNLTVENALPVLDHCLLLGVSKGLEKHCWCIIDQHASEVANNDQLIEIDHGTLTSFLSRDALVVKEIVLFRAAVRWAGRECQRLSIPLTVENKRRALGDAFYSIRFPLMSVKEFTEEVAQSSFLSHEEVANLYVGFNSNFTSCNIRFPTEPRAASVQDTAFRSPRFESTALRSKSKSVVPQQSTVKFKVSQPININGVALFPCFTQSMSQPFRVQLRDNSDSLLMSHNADLVKRDNDSDTHDIFFPGGVTLESETVYAITVSSEDVLERYGEGPIREVTCEGVDFEFLEESGDEEEKGQIQELLFKPLGQETVPESTAEDYARVTTALYLEKESE